MASTATVFLLLVLTVSTFSVDPHIIAHEAKSDIVFRRQLYSFLDDVAQKAKMSREEVIDVMRKMFKFERFFALSESDEKVGECFFCNIIYRAIMDLYLAVGSDDLAARVATKACILLNIGDPEVCAGSMELNTPHLFYIMKNTEDIHKHIPEMCSRNTGNNCDDLTGEEWLVELPDVSKPPVEEVPLPEEGKPTLKVLHIADVHFDPEYVIGSNAVCTTDLCCREPLDNSTGPFEAAGIWGAYSKCDNPSHLLENYFEHLSTTHKDIDYIMWTGDSPPHNSWMQSRDFNKMCTKTVNDFIRKYFPGVPVYPTVGNHDVCPQDMYIPYDESLAGHEQFDISWFTDFIWGDWTKEWLNKDLAHKDFYYSVQVFPGFRIIGLNSNYNYNADPWTYHFYEDPAHQLKWLAEQLQDAEDKGDKVHILVHHPTGSCARKVYSHNIARIIVRYESTVRAVFAGHTHYDEFQLYTDPEDDHRAAVVNYVSPSPTPWADLNPAYRLITVDGDYEGSTHAVLDVENWYMDLEKANSPESNYTPEWKRLYNAKETYKMDDLSPDSWKKVLNQLVEDEDLFNTYWRFWHRGAPTRGPCEGECRRNRLCFIATGDASNTQLCDTIPQY